MQFKTTFSARFPTEKSCVRYLEKVRWSGKSVCPRCGSSKCYKIATRKNYKCSACRRTFTVRHGTIFEDSKLPLRQWFEAIWLLTTTRPGMSSVELAEKLGVTQKTAWFVLQRIQYAVSHSSFDKPLEGEVEMDDFEPHKRKDHVKGARVLGIIERKGEVRTEVVPSISRFGVLNAAKKHVAEGSSISTDDWGSYKTLSKAGYEHASIVHSKGEYARGKTHTNTVEGYFGNFSRRLKGVHIRVSPKHLQKYCDMYGYRYNRRKLSPAERFDSWFANLTSRLTYQTLTA